MLGKLIPANQIGRFFGLTNFLGTGTGVLGAWGTAWLLDRYGFPSGYIWCFALAGILVLLSWLFLAQVREPASRHMPPRVSEREYWRRLPSVLRSDANFARYLLSQVVSALGGMAIGFLMVYGRERWQLPDGQAGILTASMLIGQALANLLFGPLADRRGHKLVLELSTLLGVMAMGLAALAPRPAWFYLVFALLGANSAGMLLSGLMIALDFGPADQRATYIGLNNTVRGMASGLAPLLGGWLATMLGYQSMFVVSFAVGLVGLALLRWSVREPRLEPAAVKG
jgi:MFS family permease